MTNMVYYFFLLLVLCFNLFQNEKTYAQNILDKQSTETPLVDIYNRIFNKLKSKYGVNHKKRNLNIAETLSRNLEERYQQNIFFEFEIYDITSKFLKKNMLDIYQNSDIEKLLFDYIILLAKSNQSMNELNHIKLNEENKVLKNLTNIHFLTLCSKFFEAIDLKKFSELDDLRKDIIFIYQNLDTTHLFYEQSTILDVINMIAVSHNLDKERLILAYQNSFDDMELEYLNEVMFYYKKMMKKIPNLIVKEKNFNQDSPLAIIANFLEWIIYDEHSILKKWIKISEKEKIFQFDILKDFDEILKITQIDINQEKIEKKQKIETQRLINFVTIHYYHFKEHQKEEEKLNQKKIEEKEKEIENFKKNIFDKYGINLVNIYTKIYNKYLNQEEIKLDFLVSTSEISVEQYEKCVNAKVCWIPSNDNSQSCNWNVPNKKDHPMNCITWKEAEIYAKWLNASLPTKIQWEKFSKNGEGSKYPWGTEDINCNIIAYSNSWSLYCNKFSTSKICDKNRKYSNGLCDIYGNVWEILNDDCSNSTCGENSKIIKGGSWKSSAKDILSEKEMLYFNRADDIGFRIVINVQ